MTDNIQKTYPRDVFMYLLNTIVLYISASGFLSLVFDYINAAFPDKLNPYFDVGSSIRWTLSLFLIIFAVFIWTSRFIERDLVKDPAKAELKIRRWLVYLTIFLAALLLIGDVIALVYNFLGGDLTWPFILKIVSVFAVGGVVFWYYLYMLKKEPGKFSSGARAIIWISMAIAVAAIVYGFFLAGSPFRQRSIRFDSQRVSDLQSVQSQIVYYWQQKSKLPGSLDDLKDSISGFAPPSDPDSGKAYGYRITGDLSFELCAEFALPSETRTTIQPMIYPPRDNWDHGTGNVCFNRSIDPELYRINNIPKPIPPVKSSL